MPTAAFNNLVKRFLLLRMCSEVITMKLHVDVLVNLQQNFCRPLCQELDGVLIIFLAEHAN